MKLKLDENLSRHLKDQLVALGHDTLTPIPSFLSFVAEARTPAYTECQGVTAR